MFILNILFFAIYYLHGGRTSGLFNGVCVVTTFLGTLFGFPLLCFTPFLKWLRTLSFFHFGYAMLACIVASLTSVWLYYRTGRRYRKVLCKYGKYFKKGWGVTINSVIVYVLYIILEGGMVVANYLLFL